MTGIIQSAISNPARILIVRVGALGDTLMVTPLIRLLHRHHPKSKIDFLSSALAAPLLELNPYLSGLHGLCGRNFPLLFSPEKRWLVRQFRARDYSLAILLESAPRYRTPLERARLQHNRSFPETPIDSGLHAIVNNLSVADIRDYQEDWEIYG
jgi:hypothetical protein